jgi:hypothetical protein
MNNLLFALQNSWLNFAQTVGVFAANPGVWGFVLGFGASTIIHLLVVADNPRSVAHIITKDMSVSYNTLAERKSDGTYETSYSQFEKEYNRVRIIFFSALLALIAALGIASVRFLMG